MITYMCNYCKQPINLNEKNCTHFRISFGERAINSRGQYGDAYDGDLCEKCYMKLQKNIDVHYYGGGNYLEQERRKTAKEIYVLARQFASQAAFPEGMFHKFIKEIKDRYGIEVEE